mmetsp:Transcript_18889/g.38957  ORF Transcript_18889/g.38957 Transcript_18889/m.38957 type:complete len:121 (+) Transcript_18889:713-1075(+)
MVYMAKLLLQCTTRRARKPLFLNACSGKKQWSDLTPWTGSSEASSPWQVFRTSILLSFFVIAKPSHSMENRKLTVPKMQKLARQPACEQISGAKTEATICPKRKANARAASEHPRSDAGT